MSGFEALVAECARPVFLVSNCRREGARGSGLLERNAVLRHRVEATLPDESNVAGIGRREAPGEEGGDSIAADCAHLLCQLIVHC